MYDPVNVEIARFQICVSWELIAIVQILQWVK